MLEAYTVTLEDEDGDYYDYIVNAISEDDAMDQVVLLGVDPDDDIIEVYKGASDMPVRSDLRKQQRVAWLINYQDHILDISNMVLN